ncbi:hypothetical protein MKW98_001517 [Papaver atlanticum]|uniref:Protein SCAI n=1 Tax=Papaver atlanticum TaxID=357466 RepID=A0AAD4SAC7_9MAGN|nr:hypothetical protein MKW98_001517 [Papaver atlanticum]
MGDGDNSDSDDRVTVARKFRLLVEKADRKFVRVRDIPINPNKFPNHYYRKVFKVYTQLWRFQQENRAKLVESGLQRWEIGEIASRIGQLYFNQYMRSSETRFLLECYVFYEAILNRAYFDDQSKGVMRSVMKKKDLSLKYKELRFFARYLVVALILNRVDTVKVLVERFKALVDDCKSTFKETNFREWKLVLQEIVRFLKVDTTFMDAKPLRYCAKFDTYPASLSHVARFHAKRVLKLNDALLTSYHRNEVKFTELTLDTFRMLQCLEWEPSGAFFQMRTTEPDNHVNSNGQTEASGLIDINLAMDMTDPTLPLNPRKAILYRPTATHLVSVIATICEELPLDSVFLIYISASGKTGKTTTSHIQNVGASRNSLNNKVDSQSFRGSDEGDSYDSGEDYLWLGPKGNAASNNLYPGDLIPFTRRPLFLIVDSDNSHAFKTLHGAERGETAALLLSPRRPAFWGSSYAGDPSKNGSQFTLFLTAPLQAFCQLVGLSCSDIDKEIYSQADEILSSTFSEWEIKLCKPYSLDLVWAQVLPDPFLRRLILRFIFCRSSLYLFCLREDGEEYLPDCLPKLPDDVSPSSEAIQSNILQLAECLGVTNHFNFDIC